MILFGATGIIFEVAKQSAAYHPVEVLNATTWKGGIPTLASYSQSQIHKKNVTPSGARDPGNLNYGRE
jgi:hypothetical protein